MNDYWIKYQEFCDNLKLKGELEIVERLADAQKYVNGMTDGWYEFLSKLRLTRKDFNTRLSNEDLKTIDYLIERIDKRLKV